MTPQPENPTDLTIHSFLSQVMAAGAVARDNGQDPEDVPPIYENILRSMLCDEVDNYTDFLTDHPDEYLEYAYQRKRAIELGYAPYSQSDLPSLLVALGRLIAWLFLVGIAIWLLGEVFQ